MPNLVLNQPRPRQASSPLLRAHSYVCAALSAASFFVRKPAVAAKAAFRLTPIEGRWEHTRTIDDGVALPPSPRAISTGLTKSGAVGQQRTAATRPWSADDKQTEKRHRLRRAGWLCVRVVHSYRSCSNERSMIPDELDDTLIRSVIRRLHKRRKKQCPAKRQDT